MELQMRRLFSVSMSMSLALLASPLALAAQEPSWYTPVTLEVYAGGSQFGRFLEQQVVGTGDRELAAELGPVAGGSVGVAPWRNTAVRVGFTWSPTTLRFDDDTGDGSADLDVDDLEELDTYLFSLEVLRFLGGEQRRVAPYATAGVSASLWRLNESDGGGALIVGGEDSLWRLGGTGGLGVRVRASSATSLRLEVNNFALRNPFDGNRAFRVNSGQTLEEPELVRVSRLTLGLTYDLGR
jgi:hypothetical protein